MKQIDTIESISRCLRKALLAGAEVEIDGRCYRYFHKGDELECENHVYQIQQDGVFIRVDVWRKSRPFEDPPDGRRWIIFCTHVDEMVPLMAALGPKEQELLLQQLVFQNGMQGMKRER